MEIVYLIVGLLMGAIVVFLYKKNAVANATSNLNKALSEQQEQATKEKSALEQELAIAQNNLENEKKASAERLELEKKNAVERIEQEKKNAEDRIEQEKKRAEERLNDSVSHYEELISKQREQQEASAKALREEITNIATRMLDDSKQQLSAENKEKIEGLLKPLREQLDSFNEKVTKSTEQSATNKTELKTVFEDAMKKFHDEQESTVRAMKDSQERTVKELKEQTEKIGNDAESLTKALKGDTKMQGDWGEMILDKTLEDCGLEKDKQYFLQQNYKDADGNNYRPDAIVEFPNQERAVIDSKVSLTAYQEAVKCDDADERERLLKEHVKSVRKHIDELANVNYAKIVPGCIGYVLMFIPYESGYAAALKTDSSLLQYAYGKHIIVLSPSNLLMALQLTHTMWQNYRMNKNVEEILKQSNDLYDKFCNFAETFVKIGSDIEKMRKDYDAAHGQLSEGRGNVVRRLENLKTLGINPSKEIPKEI